MKKHISQQLGSSIPLLLIWVFFSFVSINCIAQVGIGNTSPRTEAILDIGNDDAKQGMLIPRVNIEDLNSLAPITTATATEGLMVFNTNTATGEGFYYWNGTGNWVAVGEETNTLGLQFFSYDYETPESCEEVCVVWFFGCWAWETICEYGWDNSPRIPNMLSPRQEDLSGQYMSVLNLAATNFSSSGLMPTSAETFIIKLVGYYEVENEGPYTINSNSNDGVRLYVDDALVIDRWVDGQNVAGSGTVNLAKGKHKFEFWYYNNMNTPRFNFQWDNGNPFGPAGNMNATQFTID